MFGKKQPRVVEVTFMQGPLDGFSQSMLESDLHGELAFPVSRRLFDVMAGEHDVPRSRVTSIAVYRRYLDHGGVRYQFARTLLPDGTTASTHNDHC